MFPTVKFIFYPLTHAAAIAVVFFSMRHYFKVSEPGRFNRLALAMTAIYLFSHGVMSKVFHFAFQTDDPFPWLSFLNPVFYFRPGFWGWLMAFLPLSCLFPFVVRKVDRLQFFRGLALTLPLIVGLQKIACFVAGCCNGVATALPWAVVFPPGSSASIRNTPVHPTQIYDLLLALSWFLILRLMDRRERLRPYLFPSFLILYGVSRFFSEMLRPAFETGFSGSQKLELIAIAGVTFMLFFGRKLWLRILHVSPAAE